MGKLFFNVVQTKCFVLKTEKTCGKRSWWGKCEKEELKKQAYLRDPLPYWWNIFQLELIIIIIMTMNIITEEMLFWNSQIISYYYKIPSLMYYS